MVEPIASTSSLQLTSNKVFANVPSNSAKTKEEPVLYVQVINDSSGRPQEDMIVIVGPLNSTGDVSKALSHLVCCAPSPPPGPPRIGGVLDIWGCGYQVPNGGIIREEDNKVVAFAPNGTRLSFPACPTEHHVTNGTGWVKVFPKPTPYYLVFVGNIPGHTYHDAVPIHIDQTTFVTVSIPSGRFDVKFGG